MRRFAFTALLITLPATGLLTSCGPDETPEQKLERLRYNHEIFPVGTTTLHDDEGNPTLLVDLNIANQGTEPLSNLTVLVRVRGAGRRVLRGQLRRRGQTEDKTGQKYETLHARAAISVQMIGVPLWLARNRERMMQSHNVCTIMRGPSRGSAPLLAGAARGRHTSGPTVRSQ